MDDDIFLAAIGVLEKIASGPRDADWDVGIGHLERLARQRGSGADFDRLQHSLGRIRNEQRDSAVSDKALNLLIDTTHDLSQTLKLEDLLRTIVTRARTLVGANVAWVTVLDDKDGMFRTVNAEGYLSPATSEMTARIDYGAVGLIMKSKSVFYTQDYLADTRFQHLPELDQIFRTENIVSLAGFPMLSGNEVHGFLFVADRYSRKLTGREMSVLGSFALHAGVAMRNANAFRRLSEALDEAQRNRKALIDHIQRVEASAAAHDEMTSLLASGAELQHFLQRMANQIGGAIFLYDEGFRVRDEFASDAYCGVLAQDLRSGRADPALLISARSKSRATGRSVVALKTSVEQCRTIALHGGTERGESLVICYQGALDAIDIRNLERNAVALSIAKLWNEKREAEKTIASSTLLRHLALVSPPDEPTISAIRDRLSLGADQPVMLALIAFSDLDRAAQTETVRDCAYRLNLLVDLIEDTYLAVGPEAELGAFLQNLDLRRDGWSVGGILSEPFADLDATAAAYRRLGQALQVLRTMRPLDHFLPQSEVNLFAKIFEAGDAPRLARYLTGILAPIAARAPRQQAQLKLTLLRFFENQYSVKRTAEMLGLHINTIRQRLHLLRDIIGGWDDPVRALELQVALRLDALVTGRDDPG